MRYSEETCKLVAEFVARMDQRFGNDRPDGFQARSDFDQFHQLRQEMKREEREWREPRAVRERQGLTIEDCAKVHGVTPATWSAWERGEVKRMQPIAEKVTPLVEQAARHFLDGQLQTDIEDFTGEAA